MDLSRAQDIYPERVKDSRGNIDSLFVTYGAGQMKSPCSKTIDRWLVSTFKVVPDSVRQGLVRAHSTMSVSTTVAFAWGVSEDSILKAAD